MAIRRNQDHVLQVVAHAVNCHHGLESDGHSRSQHLGCVSCIKTYCMDLPEWSSVFDEHGLDGALAHICFHILTLPLYFLPPRCVYVSFPHTIVKRAEASLIGSHKNVPDFALARAEMA